MAFNNGGDFWLAPGESTRIRFKFGQIAGEPEYGGHDMGAQWAMADPMGINSGQLLVKDHTKIHQPRRHPGPEAVVAYAVTVVNIGGEGVRFSMQGGGNV